MRSIAGTVPGAKPLISLTAADLPTAWLLEIQQYGAGPLFKPAHRARCPVCNTRAVHRCSTIVVSSNRPAEGGIGTGDDKRAYKSDAASI
jgi:hypothetical protein